MGMARIMSSFYIGMSNGTVQELLPIDLTLTETLDGAVYIEGTCFPGSVCDIDPQPIDGASAEELDEFLRSFKVDKDGGSDV